MWDVLGRNWGQWSTRVSVDDWDLSGLDGRSGRVGATGGDNDQTLDGRGQRGDQRAGVTTIVDNWDQWGSSEFDVGVGEVSVVDSDGAVAVDQSWWSWGEEPLDLLGIIDDSDW